jgi:hypothetical protein
MSTAPYIHYLALEDLPPDHPLATEWATYKREAGRLLAEGHQGKYALVKGNQVVSLWDTWGDAVQAGFERFGLGGFMVHQVQYWERILRVGRYY